MHAYKKNSNGDHIGGCLFFPNLHNHLQVKVHFDFQKKKKKKGTFKVSVNQFQVVVHAAGNATFALCVQLNL